MKSKTIIGYLLAIVAVAYFVIYQGFWVWVVENTVVPPGHMLVLVSKSGRDMAPGQIIAEKGQKGVLLEPLGPGRHFINPLFYESKLEPQKEIGPNQVGIVIAKFGKELPTGEFLASPGERGIQRDVLPPGTYKLNPYAFNVRVVPMRELAPGFVGVVTSRSGKTASGALANPGERGVMKDVLPPGLYAINPEAYTLEAVEIGFNQITMAHGKPPVAQTKTGAEGAKVESGARYAQAVGEGTGNSPAGTSELPVLHAVTFPSSDGFEVMIDVTLLWQLLPQDAPSVYARYGNVNKIEQNILIPQINSAVRLKGSAFGAVNFIVGEEREKFQLSFQQTVETTLQAKQLQVDMALVQGTFVPDSISGPIQDARAAFEWNLTNDEKRQTEAKKAELDETKGKIAQIEQVVDFETQRLEGNLMAEREKAEQEINAQTKILVADLNRKTAAVKADIARKIGSANAKVVELKGQAEGDGYSQLVKSAGSATDYAAYMFAANLPTTLKLSFFYAGPGTMWTDLKEIGGAAAMVPLGQPKK